MKIETIYGESILVKEVLSARLSPKQLISETDPGYDTEIIASGGKKYRVVGKPEDYIQ